MFITQLDFNTTSSPSFSDILLMFELKHCATINSNFVDEIASHITLKLASHIINQSLGAQEKGINLFKSSKECR